MKKLFFILICLSAIPSLHASEFLDNETDTIYEGVNLNKDFLLYIPSAFSPNNDGRNDVFAPVGAGITIDYYEMRIYNRSGQLVFLTTEINVPWDGNITGKGFDEITTEVFVYHITVRTFEGAEREYFGHITRIP